MPNYQFVQDYRPDFMVNKTTNRNYEIDIYCEKIKLGFEYQGAIHFKRISKYNNNPDESRYNDIKKAIIAESINGKFCIVEIFETDLIGNIRLNIQNRIYNTFTYFNTQKGCKNRLLFNIYLGVKYGNEYGFHVSIAHILLYGKNNINIKRPDDMNDEIIKFKEERKTLKMVKNKYTGKRLTPEQVIARFKIKA